MSGFEGMHGVFYVHKRLLLACSMCMSACVCLCQTYLLPKIPWIIILWNMQNVQLAMRRIPHFTQW